MMAKRKDSTTMPTIGDRYLCGEGKFTKTLEYVGLNPRPMYEAQDRHVVRVVKTYPGARDLGNESLVEPKWFETHERVR
jgi:hypothetical protein